MIFQSLNNPLNMRKLYTVVLDQVLIFLKVLYNDTYTHFPYLWHDILHASSCITQSLDRSYDVSRILLLYLMKTCKKRSWKFWEIDAQVNEYLFFQRFQISEE